MPDVIEPLRRLSCVARRPAPIVGFERPPAPLVASLRAAAAEAAAGAATLALLEAAPKRSCEALLAELRERQERAEMSAHEALRVRWSCIEPRVFSVLALALADIARGVDDGAA